MSGVEVRMHSVDSDSFMSTVYIYVYYSIEFADYRISDNFIGGLEWHGDDIALLVFLYELDTHIPTTSFKLVIPKGETPLEKYHANAALLKSPTMMQIVCRWRNTSNQNAYAGGIYQGLKEGARVVFSSTNPCVHLERSKRSKRSFCWRSREWDEPRNLAL